MKSCVKVLLMDVDGTLTDGRIYIGTAGEVMKVFDVKDGYGIKNVLPQCNIHPVIVTGRSSEIIQRRAYELGVAEIFQGAEDKVECLKLICEKFSVTCQEVAYIGDDLNDLACMKFCGVTGCPADAVIAVKEQCDYICQVPGGHGAVREFIEWLIQLNKG